MVDILKKIFKLLFYFLIIGVFVVLVDFKSLSFKTVIPEKDSRIQIEEKTEAGIIRNSEEVILTDLNQFQGTKSEIISLVNEARKKENLKELKENNLLNLSALEKAQHMKDNNYFDHVSPQGLQPWYFAQKQKYEYKFFGENLAEGYFSANSVHTGWMNSPGHRDNILSKDFEEIGVAILDFEQEGQRSYLIVQHFGTKLSAADLVTEIVCKEESKEYCEEAEEQEEKLKKLIEEQERIIEKAEEAGAGSKDLNRLEENLEEMKDSEEELEDYLEECEEFIKKCDTFK